MNELIEYFNNRIYRDNCGYLTVWGDTSVLETITKIKYNGIVIHPEGTILHNTDLHIPGVERGVCEYGGYGRYASKPILVQREISQFLLAG